MTTEILQIIPVLPSADVERDILWYGEKTGFECRFRATVNDDKTVGYAVLGRQNHYLHLQWHADTEEDPLLGGSVIRILVKSILPLFEEFVERGTVTREDFRANTPWGTNEFGFYDLNKNAIFFLEEIG